MRLVFALLLASLVCGCIIEEYIITEQIPVPQTSLEDCGNMMSVEEKDFCYIEVGERDADEKACELISMQEEN